MKPDDVLTDEQRLHAFLDGELPADQRAEFEARLAREPDLAAGAEAFERIAERLRSFDQVLDEPVPLNLVSAAAVPAPRWPGLATAAAFVAGVALGLAVGWLRPAPEPAPGAVQRAVPVEARLAHAVYTRERRHAVEVRADELEHLNAWLSKRLTHEVAAPDLRDAGYQLIGGRLLADAAGPAAHFMYENRDKVRFTLFVRAPGPRIVASAGDYVGAEEYGVLYWTDGPLAYAWTGPPDRPVLTRLAELTRSFLGAGRR